MNEWNGYQNSQVILPASCQKQLLCQIEDTCSPLQSDNDFPPVSEWKIKNDSNIILIINIKQTSVYTLQFYMTHIQDPPSYKLTWQGLL